MLILAGTAVAISVNSGDIFGKASEAREKWNMAVSEEQTSANSYLSILDDVDNGVSIPNVADIDPNETNLPTKKTAAELSDYIPIYTAEQLQKVATGEQLTIEGTQYTMAANAKYALMNDLSNITMSSIKGFTGEFEGNGCTISGLNIDTRSDANTYTTLTGWTNSKYPGALFSSIVNGTVKNLAIEGANIKSVESVAAIAGQADNFTIDNCYVKNCSLEWTGSNNYNAHGCIVGFIGNNGGTISNCKVVNTKTSFGGCGICGGSYGNTTINNCQVYGDNTVIYRTGIIGNATKTLNINNCSVQGVTLYESGVIAVAQSGQGNSLNIKNTAVKNINYEMDTYWDSYGLFINTSFSPTTIEGCHMQDCTVNCTRNRRQSIGILTNYCNTGVTTIKDTTVNGITTKGGISCLTGASLSSYGGIEITNTTIANIKTEQAINGFSGLVQHSGGDVLVDGCNVDKVTLLMRQETQSASGVYSSAKGAQVGGIVTFIGMNQNFDIKNCKVSNFNVSGTVGGTAGIILIAEGWSNTTTTKNITNCKVSNIKVNDSWTGYNNEYSDYRLFGGIAGQVGKTNMENCAVNGFEVETPFGVLGGIVSSSNYSNIKKCKAKNINLKSINDTAGGLGVYSYDTAIEECEISNATIQSKKSAGGLLASYHNGYNSEHKNIKNCKVSDSTINGEVNVGGIAGFVYEEEITGCTVTNVTVHSTTGSVGGIAGLTYNALITGCNTASSNIKGEVASGASQVVYAGGIAGYSHTIRNCNVTDTNIETTNDIGVGGIVGQGHKYKNSEPLIENCNVTGGSVKGKSSVGGISGVAITTLTGCTAKDITITGTGSNVGGIQGCGGELGDPANYKSNVPVTMTNCHVINCTIRGASDVGYLQGKNTYGYEGVTDTFTNSDYDAQTTIQ